MGTLKKTLLFFLSLRLLAILGYFSLAEHYAPLDFLHSFWQHNYLLWSWANFDGEHYLSIAKFGYGWRGGMPQYAFFPLLPLLTKLVALLVRDYFLAGQLVIFTSVYFIIKLLPAWLSQLKQKLAYPLIAFFLLPGIVFLGSIYTEPVFIALTLLVFLNTERKQYFRASLFSALVTATRISGVFTALFFNLKLWRSSLSFIKKLTLSFTSILGLVAYSFYLFILTGDPLKWYHAQGAWDKATPTPPWITLTNYIKALTIELSFDLTHLVVFFEVLITCWAIYLTYQFWRKRVLDFSYLLYLLGNLSLPIITGSLGSMPRFILTLFPLITVYNYLKPSTRKLSYFISAIIMLTGIILFTRGRWYA